MNRRFGLAQIGGGISRQIGAQKGSGFRKGQTKVRLGTNLYMKIARRAIEQMPAGEFVLGKKVEMISRDKHRREITRRPETHQRPPDRFEGEFVLV